MTYHIWIQKNSQTKVHILTNINNEIQFYLVHITQQVGTPSKSPKLFPTQ